MSMSIPEQGLLFSQALIATNYYSRRSSSSKLCSSTLISRTHFGLYLPLSDTVSYLILLVVSGKHIYFLYWLFQSGWLWTTQEWRLCFSSIYLSTLLGFPEDEASIFRSIVYRSMHYASVETANVEWGMMISMVLQYCGISAGCKWLTSTSRSKQLWPDCSLISLLIWSYSFHFKLSCASCASLCLRVLVVNYSITSF